MVLYLKLIKRFIVKLFFHILDAGYDFYRHLRYSNSLYNSTHDRQKLEAILFFNYHKIEKALVMPEVKPLFGLNYIGSLLDLMEKWVQLTGRDIEAAVFRGAYASLVQYRDHVGESLSRSNPALAHRVDKFLANYNDTVYDQNIGGSITITAKEFQAACEDIDFGCFVNYRRSVRNFSQQHIPDDIIEDAVELAQRSPSVCNRQCWRVHVFTSDADKSKILQHQNGNSGFGHLADRVLLITADLRSFLSSGERNQGYIDSGMFAMTLLYALQSHGVVSCCLNLSISFNQDLALRRACRIPISETPIMMIAIGYPPECFRVAAAARVSVQNVLSFRNPGIGQGHDG